MKPSIFIVLIIAGLLAGCERPTQKSVAEWKAEGNVKKLITALGSTDRRTSIPAAQALGELKAEQAVEPLASLFYSPDSQRVIAAIQALASIGNEPAETHLIAALKLKDRRVHTAAIAGLGALKSTRAIDPLTEILNTNDPRVATAAAVSLGLINDKTAIKPLAAKIGSPSYSLRFACVESIGSMGGEEAAEALAGLIGDNYSDLREIAIDTLIASGTFAEPYALDALHGKNTQARQSAATILKAIDAVPAGGKIRIFYLIAQIPPQTKGIDDSIVSQLAEMGNEAVGLLLKAVSHETPNIREHAFRALETIGKPCVAQAIQAVETHATPAGKKWFSERAVWEGAPSWRLDLWGAATALNPDFNPPDIETEGLSPKKQAVQVLTATQREIPREYIPLLIPLLAPFGMDSTDAVKEPDSISLFGSASREMKTIIDFRETTEKRLIDAGDIALFPLLAATGSSSKKIADSCRKILHETGHLPQKQK